MDNDFWIALMVIIIAYTYPLVRIFTVSDRVSKVNSIVLWLYMNTIVAMVLAALLDMVVIGFAVLVLSLYGVQKLAEMSVS